MNKLTKVMFKNNNLLNSKFAKTIFKSFATSNKSLEYSSSNNWESEVNKSEVPVLVDCYADWCGPCKKLMPQLTKRVDATEKIKFIKVNIDNNQEIAEKLGVSSIPAVFLIHKGKVVDQFVGAPDENKLDAFFEKAKNLH